MIMINLLMGIFSFLEYLVKPLWGIVIIVFIAILVLLSKTIISEAKKKQQGIKPKTLRSDFFREIEAYSEMPYIRKTFDGKESQFKSIKFDENDLLIDEEIPKPKKKIISKKK